MILSTNMDELVKLLNRDSKEESGCTLLIIRGIETSISVLRVALCCVATVSVIRSMAFIEVFSTVVAIES